MGFGASNNNNARYDIHTTNDAARECSMGNRATSVWWFMAYMCALPSSALTKLTDSTPNKWVRVAYGYVCSLSQPQNRPLKPKTPMYGWCGSQIHAHISHTLNTHTSNACSLYSAFKTDYMGYINRSHNISIHSPQHALESIFYLFVKHITPWLEIYVCYSMQTYTYFLYTLSMKSTYMYKHPERIDKAEHYTDQWCCSLSSPIELHISNLYLLVTSILDLSLLQLWCSSLLYTHITRATQILQMCFSSWVYMYKQCLYIVLSKIPFSTHTRNTHSDNSTRLSSTFLIAFQITTHKYTTQTARWVRRCQIAFGWIAQSSRLAHGVWFSS